MHLTAAEPVALGGSTKTVLVTNAHRASRAAVEVNRAAEAEVVATLLATPVATALLDTVTRTACVVAGTLVVIVDSAMTEPVTEALGGTVAVAVIFVGAAAVVCVWAAPPQDSF